MTQKISSTNPKPVSATDRIGNLAAKIPQASRVFARHQIDYCCGGNHTLADACDLAKVDVAIVLAEINEELKRDHTGILPDGLTLEDLITHIQKTYHEPLREELPRLEEMARKVARVHAERDGERLAALAETVSELKAEILTHLDKEDGILFPLICAGSGAMAQMPISRMQKDHDDHGTSLRRIRKLTADFKVPGDACMTWRALWKSLEELERSLHEHIHLENNILFPKTLAD